MVNRALIVLSLVVVGCAHHEYENPRFRVMDAKITEGVTTESELFRKLGAPPSRWIDTPAAGRDTLVWPYQVPTFTMSRSAYLLVVVKSGVVESYRRVQSLDAVVTP